MDKTRIDKFRAVATALAASDQQITILISQVDPDALGAAYGLKLALQELGLVKLRVAYAGVIGHPQNRAIVYKYSLQMKLAKDLRCDDPGEVFLLVDSSSTTDVRLKHLNGFAPQIVIDHHRGANVEETEDSFVWVEDYGAASTMVAQLLLGLNENIFVKDHSAWIATLLALGIYTDTKSLISAGVQDREAYTAVSRFADPDDFKQMVEYPISARSTDHFKLALEHRGSIGSRLVTHIGFIDPEFGDDLSTIADYLIRTDGVSLVVVWGVIGNTVRISARCTDISTPLDEFLRSRFGDKAGAKLLPDGRSEGGALMELDFPFWLVPGTKAETIALVHRRIAIAILEQ